VAAGLSGQIGFAAIYFEKVLFLSHNREALDERWDNRETGRIPCHSMVV